MRIAVICSDLGVRVPGRKGASLHLQAIASAFGSIGHEVFLVGVAGHGPPPTGLASLLLPHPGRSTGIENERNKIAFTERLFAEAQEPLRAFEPDLVYERLSLFGTAGLRLALVNSAPHVLEVNALLTQEQAAWRGLHLGSLARRCERVALRATALRVVVSAELGRAVDALAPGPPTAVVPNGVDVAAFRALPTQREARRHLALPPDRLLVGFAGTLRPWHGLDGAIDALALSRLPFHLAVAGDGAVRADLQRRAEERGVAHRVHWLGQLLPQEMPRFLASLDVAVAPYPELPGFAFSPLKLYEYLAAGVPVVASDIGQIPEVLGYGRWGHLVRPGSARDLAYGLDSVLADLPAARAAAAIGRDVALAEHGWDVRARDVIDRIEDVRSALAG